MHGINRHRIKHRMIHHSMLGRYAWSIEVELHEIDIRQNMQMKYATKKDNPWYTDMNMMYVTGELNGTGQRYKILWIKPTPPFMGDQSGVARSTLLPLCSRHHWLRRHLGICIKDPEKFIKYKWI